MSSSTPEEACPTPAELEALSAGRLGERAVAALEEHLSGCEGCCARLEQLGAPFLGELQPRSGGSPAPGEASSGALQQLMNDLKSAPEDMRSTPLAASDELTTLLDTQVGGKARAGSLGSYEVRREVARGGMGIVLEAFDPELRRTVAIKVLAPSLAAVAKFRDAFLSEARAAAQLQHENVMPVYAVDQQGPLPYLVMPFVEGPTLQEKLDAHGALPIAEVVTIGHQVSRALEAAHAHKLVHGDLKPGNIMLLDDGGDRRAWLADFGLARVTGEQPVLEGGGAPVAGTPAYMAPEQVAGHGADPRSDLFALGGVLHAMLTGGHSPFASDSVETTIARVCHEAHQPLREEVPGLPEWLARLVDALLEKDPDRRPNSATVVREVFEEHLTSRGISRRKVIVGSGMAAAAVVVALLRPWERTLPEGFLVEGRDTLFPTLDDAVAAAASGDVVLVRRNGEMELDSLEVPGGKSLTIRAAPGCHPVFVSRSWRATMLRSTAPLCLEGLEFRHPFADHPDEVVPLLHVESAPAFLANCRFERSTTERDRDRERHEARPMLRFLNCPRVRVRNCELYTMVGTHLALDVSSDEFVQELHAENNLMVGQFGIRLRAPSTSRHHWTLSRNSVVGSVPISLWTRGGEFPALEVAYERNLFDFLRCLLELRELDEVSSLKRIRSRVRLAGRSNRFRRSRRSGKESAAGFVMRSLSSEQEGVPLGIETFERFEQAFGPAGEELGAPVFDWEEIDSYRAEFSLMAADLFDLKPPLDSAADRPGFQRALLGPGPAWDNFRESDAFNAWRREVEAVLRA